MPKPAEAVLVRRAAAHGTSHLTLLDNGSDAAELVEMLREAMILVGFAPEVADRIIYTGEVVNDTNYGDLS